MRVLCAIVLLVGCSDNQRDAAPTAPVATPAPAKPAAIASAPGELSAAEAERFAAMTDQLATVVALHQADCAKLAAAIHGILDTNRDTLKQGAAARAAGKHLPAAVLARIQERVQAIATDLKPCLDDPAVQAAFARYRGEPAAKPEMPAADAARIVALVDQLAAAIAGSTTDCAKLAAAIDRVIDANRDVLALAAAAQAAGKQLPPAIYQQLVGRIQGLAPTMQRCAGDRAVTDALARFHLG